jgi:hypothetical protein
MVMVLASYNDIKPNPLPGAILNQFSAAATSTVLA